MPSKKKAKPSKETKNIGGSQVVVSHTFGPHTQEAEVVGSPHEFKVSMVFKR